MLDPSQTKLLSFDCYGTLIDWETGICNCLQPIFRAHGVTVDDESLLQMYAKFESEQESGSYRTYKAVLTAVMQKLGNEYGFRPSRQEFLALPASLPHWRPFSDTVESLRRLRERFKLGVISNVDNDLFAGTSRSLGVGFEYVITAEMARAYKPSIKVFEYALQAFGHPVEEVVHVAQSPYHDIAPANQIGLATIWVNRRQGKDGAGATPLSAAEPLLEIPDLTTLVSLIESVI